MTARRRCSRFAGCLVAAWVFLGPGTASASGVATAAPALAIATAAASLPDATSPVSASTGQDCLRAEPPPSRAAARGTMPDTGAGRSLPPLFAAAGLLVGGLVFRAAAAWLGRRESAR